MTDGASLPARGEPVRGQPVAVAVGSEDCALVWDGGDLVVPAGAAGAVVAQLDRERRPRWVWWGQDTAARLVGAGVRVAICWDVAAVHRLLAGGGAAQPGRVWAFLHGLDPAQAPRSGQLSLMDGGTDGAADGGDPQLPVGPGGHLRPEWADGGWRRDARRVRAWAQLALEAAALQRRRLLDVQASGDPIATARSESAAELLCAELAVDGLPIDLLAAQDLLVALIGPRPADDAQARAARRRRDDAVLTHAPAGAPADLRNPAQVRALLARAGIDVPDTRSWRLAPYRGAHPLVGALLEWRKTERIATTYGYAWLDRHVRAGADPGDGRRLRGDWSGSDGAAGRMTAQAGLHNLPADLRPAVAAPPGRVLVRADLGQIEPRVLAVVSGDPALTAATQEDDLYLPVARRLRVERAVAKVAVLAAMYGQTSGAAGRALRGMEAAYPVAMAYLDEAYEAGRSGGSVRTYGGRLVRASPLPPDLDEAGERSALAARGRFVRNAVIQGAAAELFKAWAATVRNRVASLGGRIVLCLHDELLVEAPDQHGGEAARLLVACLDEAAAGWAPGSGVRFVAEVSVVRRWSDVPS